MPDRELLPAATYFSKRSEINGLVMTLMYGILLLRKSFFQLFACKTRSSFCIAKKYFALSWVKPVSNVAPSQCSQLEVSAQPWKMPQQVNAVLSVVLKRSQKRVLQVLAVQLHCMNGVSTNASEGNT